MEHVLLTPHRQHPIFHITIVSQQHIVVKTCLQLHTFKYPDLVTAKASKAESFRISLTPTLSSRTAGLHISQ